MLRTVVAISTLLGTPPQQAPTEILWDTWGVPHIYAPTEREAFRAFGYAQMRSHADLLLKLYGQARGRAAEYWGPAHLAEDRYVRTMGIPGRARAWYAEQEPAFREQLDAFAAGINQYAREHPEAIVDSVERVLPVTAEDVLAHTQRVIHFVFVAGAERARAVFGSEVGSNMWAIAPKRSASGHAMLLANPHLPWNDYFLFYEAQWVVPGLNLYGATLLGFPTPAIAFNDHLGWSHTVNTYDGADLYRLTLTAGGYAWDGGAKPFETWREVLQVRQPDGALRPDTLVIRRSVHGPVIKDSAGTALALRVAGLDRPHMLAQWWQMGQAQNLAGFEAAMRRLQIPMFNVIYADRAGHILYLYNAAVPERPRGDVAQWEGVMRGDSAATLWTRLLPYERLPRLLDPPNGWLQNANDPPWTVTVPVQLRREDFPAYLAPSFMHFRAQRSARMLVADSSIGFDELIRYKHDTRMELADRLLDELIGAARASGRPMAARAADVLARWDRQANADSRGAVLFTLWALQATGRAPIAGPSPLFAVPWRPDSAIATPYRLADAAKAVGQLEAVAAGVEKAYGSLDVAYGDVMRIRVGARDLPGHGANGDPMGVFRVQFYAPAEGGKWATVGGDSYYAAIEFGPTIRAKVLLAYGNATQPGSPHAGDQLELFMRKEMRDAWRTRQEVEANLERRETVK
jgi:acyl-homoserine-lactone acylase